MKHSKRAGNGGIEPHSSYCYFPVAPADMGRTLQSAYPLTGFRSPSVAVLFPAIHRFTAFRRLS